MGILKDRRLWLALAAVGGLLAARQAGFGDYLSLEALRAHRDALTGFVAAHRALAAAIFVAAYACAVTLSLPGATILTLTGGFLFGAWLGAALNIVGATAGAVLLFLLAKTILGTNALDRFGEGAARLARNIRANAWSYLLVLRLVPLFPFFLVNLVPAFAGVSLPVFALTTFVGIMPGTIVFTLAGAGLGGVLDQGGALTPSAILTPEILAGLIGLALLSLAAIPLKRRFMADEKG